MVPDMRKFYPCEYIFLNLYEFCIILFDALFRGAHILYTCLAFL